MFGKQLLLLGKYTFMMISVKLCEISVKNITTASVIPIAPNSSFWVKKASRYDSRIYKETNRKENKWIYNVIFSYVINGATTFQINFNHINMRCFFVKY